MKLSFYTINQYANAGNEIPEYVKTASLEDITRDSLDSRANVWAQALNYYTSNNTNVPLEQIIKRAKYFGNYEDLEEMQSAFEKQAATIAENADYAICGNGIRAYPVRSEEEWHAANHFLNKNANTLPTSFKTLMAKKLLEKSAQYDIRVYDGDKLLKYAGIGYPIEEEVAEELVKRAELYCDDELRKLAVAIVSNPETLSNRQFCSNLVDIMQEYDNKFAEYLGDVYADGRVLPPDDAVYTLSIKEAEELINDTVKLKTGNVYSMDDISHVKLSDIRDMFGDDVAAEVTSGIGVDAEKLAEVLKELPLPEAQVFDKFMGTQDTDTLE